jgi:sulfite dehydrogenase
MTRPSTERRFPLTAPGDAAAAPVPSADAERVAPPAAPARRRWLAAGAALGGGALAAGCASSTAPGASGPSIGRVVVVGGGFGGATAARHLRMWGGNIDVVLVERNAQFVSCPISNLVVGGFRQIGDVTRGYGGLTAIGVKVVRGEVVSIDAVARKVRLADGTELPYDRLVLSPGIDFMTDGIGGLQPALDSGRVVHAWKAGPQTVELRRQLEAMPNGGTVAMTIPATPYRCPPGPYERACMIAAYLKTAKPRSKLLVLDANPEIQSKKALFERAWGQHYKDVIEYKPNSGLREVAGTMARLEFDDVKADVLNVIPPQRAADIAMKTGLVNINNRWVGVNWLTMESTAVPGIHVLGDATFPAPAMPKSGHMANQHAKVAAAAIIQLLRGEPVNPTPVVMNTCYSFVTQRDVIHVASVHQFVAAKNTFEPVPGSGGVSAAANQIEGRYALSWAENIWTDMLG